MGRYMLIVKANTDSENGVMPSEQELADMGAFNEELVNSGLLLAGEGLHPTSNGARVTFSGGTSAVTEGSFANPETLIAGYWVLDVPSLQDAISWAQRVPFTSGEIEVRKIFEAEDFGEEFTPELQAKEQELRERVAGQQGA